MTDRPAAIAKDHDERFEPGLHGPIIQYEHLHRYAFAARALSGLHCLDLACGMGYGTALLRSAGVRAIGLDRAALPWTGQQPCLRGDASALPFADKSLQAVVCFEALEHFAEPAAVLGEIVRVLAPPAVLLLSTPDRLIYSLRAGVVNPHHLREFDRRELLELLERRFDHVQLFGQSVWAGSWITALASSGHPEKADERRFRISRQALEGPEWVPVAPWADPADADIPVPMYLVAACSMTPAGKQRIARLMQRDDLLHDSGQTLLGHYLRVQEGLVARDQQLATSDHQTRQIQNQLHQSLRHAGDVDQHAQNLLALSEFHGDRAARLASHAANLEGTVSRLEHRAESLSVHAGNLEQLASRWDQRVRRLEQHAANLEHGTFLRAERVRELSLHAKNLEQVVTRRGERILRLEQHAANLESGISGRDQRAREVSAHAENLEGVVTRREERILRLEQHAANLESGVSGRDQLAREVSAHAQNLEGVVARREERILRLERHAENLEHAIVGYETRIQALSRHSQNLEQIISARGERVHELALHAANLERCLAEENSRLRDVSGHALDLEGDVASLRNHNRALREEDERKSNHISALETHRITRDRELLVVHEQLRLWRKAFDQLRNSRWIRILMRIGAVEE